jgi:hypothetical protein
MTRLSPLSRRRLERGLIVLAALLGTLLVAGAAGGSEVLSGHARLHQFEQSGVQARASFLDDGTVLSVRATATGLDPASAYISLLYDRGSVPGGPNACEATDDSVTFEQMVAGTWVVDANGNGTLALDKAGPLYVSLRKVRTMSVRLVSGFQRVACGAIAVNPR